MAFNNPISTLGLQLQTTRAITTTQAELFARGNEIGTGIHTDVAREIGSQVGTLISFRADFEKRTAFIRSAERFDSEADLVQSSLQSIESSVVDLTAVLAVGVRDANLVTDTSLFEQATLALGDISSLLNTTVSGRFIFGGVAGDVQPVQLPDVANPNIPSGQSPNAVFQGLINQWEVATGATLATANAQQITDLFTGVGTFPGINTLFDGALEPTPATIDNNFRTVYNATDGTGTNPRVQVRIDDGITLQNGIQADDAAFRDILAGLYFLSNVRPQDLDATPVPADAPTEFINATGNFDADALLGTTITRQVPYIGENGQARNLTLEFVSQGDTTAGVDDRFTLTLTDEAPPAAPIQITDPITIDFDPVTGAPAAYGGITVPGAAAGAGYGVAYNGAATDGSINVTLPTGQVVTVELGAVNSTFGLTQSDDDTELTVSAENRTGYEAFFTQALNRLTRGAETLRLYQAELGEQQQVALNVIERHQLRQGVLNGLINDLERVDPIETQVQFAALETQLATNFEVTTRLMGLRLFNFLR